jgi:hypothetical protein
MMSLGDGETQAYRRSGGHAGIVSKQPDGRSPRRGHRFGYGSASSFTPASP